MLGELEVASSSLAGSTHYFFFDFIIRFYMIGILLVSFLANDTVTSSAANHLLFSRYLFCKLFVATIFSENEGMGTSTNTDG